MFSFDWPIDATTREECLQEWNTQVHRMIESIWNQRSARFRKSVTTMLFMFEFTRTALTWMFSPLTLIDRWFVPSTFVPCRSPMETIPFEIHILRWIQTVPMWCSPSTAVSSLRGIKAIIYRLYERPKAKPCSTPWDKVNNTHWRRDVEKNSSVVGIDAYFIDGFQYDGKAVFGVVEPSDRLETVRDMIDRWSRSYLLVWTFRLVFHD